jgi:hypothetical protein
MSYLFVVVSLMLIVRRASYLMKRTRLLLICICSGIGPVIQRELLNFFMSSSSIETPAKRLS